MTTPTIAPSTIESVRKTVTVNVPQPYAFTVYTERHGSWWPLKTHHIGAQPAETAIMEPRVGGRWFERGVDGSECEWGKVLVWEPPNRIVLAWQIGANWKYDPNLITEVEVRFVAEGPMTTRVELEHRNLDRFGENAAAIRAAFNSDGGYNGILQTFVAFAEAGENR